MLCAVFQELFQFVRRRCAAGELGVDLRNGGVRLFEPVFGVAGCFLEGAEAFLLFGSDLLRSSRLVLFGRLGPLGVVAVGLHDEGAIVGKVAIIGRGAAIVDQPEPVGRGLGKIDIVGDEQDRAGEFVQRIDQRLAAVDVEVGSRLVEDQDVRRGR